MELGTGFDVFCTACVWFLLENVKMRRVCSLEGIMSECFIQI